MSLNIKTYKKCGLCRCEKKLCESHIYPKFFFNSIKEISPTKKFRVSNDIDIRRQDGIKFKLLCLDCESKFSKYERQFKNKFFDIIKNNTIDKIDTNNKDFKYFLLSLFWRVGIMEIYHNQDKIEEEYRKFTINEITKIKEILEMYRKILLEEDIYSIEKFKMYFLPIKKMDIADKIKNKLVKMGRIDDLFEKRLIGGGVRTVDMQDSFKKCYIMIVVPNCIFLINIWGDCEISYLRRYEIGNVINISTDSTINLDDQLTNLIEYFFETCFVEADLNMSLKSRQKIIDEINQVLYGGHSCPPNG